MIDIAHFNMVEQQVRTWNVHSGSLVEAMKNLDRQLFVPADKQDLCFVDTRIALNDQDSMLAPRVAARLVQALEIGENDHVLVLGAGSGYTVALCALLAKTVVCHDASQTAIDRAAANCKRAGLDNVGFQKVGALDCRDGGVQYDGIVFREGCAEVPLTCLDHLNEGGRCVALVGQDYLMELICFTREQGETTARSIVDILMMNNDALSDSAEVKQAFVF